jgi:hypothetical protein
MALAAACLILSVGWAAESPVDGRDRVAPLMSLWTSGDERTGSGTAAAAVLDRWLVVAQAGCLSAINVCVTYNPDLKCNRNDMKKYYRSGAKWCSTGQACSC